MSKTKIHLKEYQGKNRIYVPVNGHSGILRLYEWDKEKSQYTDPPKRKKYDVRRTEVRSNGTKKRVKKTFDLLGDAILWQQGNDPGSTTREDSQTDPLTVLRDPGDESYDSFRDFVEQNQNQEDKTFKTVIEHYRKMQFADLRDSSKAKYQRLLDLYFKSLEPLPVKALCPEGIDLWLAELKESCSDSRRLTFNEEYKLLKVLITHYQEYFKESRDYVLPLRKRHAKKAC